MKATINNLWDTYREVISYDNSEIERPITFSDLEKCDNVILGEKSKHVKGARVVLIDDKINLVKVVTISGPYFSFQGLEIM